MGAVLRIVGAVAIGLPLALYLLQDKLIFYPRTLSEGQLDDLSRRFPNGKSLFAQAADGTRLHAWHVAGKPGAPLVLYFGGNAEEVSWMLDEVGERTPGIGWLLIDYRGYGASGGSPSEAALVADALLWYDKVSPEANKIYVFGRSLGSGVAVQLAAHRRVAAAILVTPFDSLVQVAKRHYPFLPVSWMLKHRFDSISYAPSLGVPLLCVVAMRDSIIPPEHAKLLYDAWAGPKRWVALEEAGHNSVDAHPLYWRSINTFLNE